MKALIDGDILLHEIGWSAQPIDPETKERFVMDWDRAASLLERSLNFMLEDTKSTAFKFFLSDTRWWAEQQGREHIPNFRYERAKTKPYKGTRKSDKPFHFNNLFSHMVNTYGAEVEVGGLEADDAMAIYQTNSPEATVICSRDKDLRMIEGWHYSWPCGKQEAVGPHYTDLIGGLLKKKGLGYGVSFFYYQMIVGDAVDNIPGLKGKGEAFAVKLLQNTPKRVEDLHNAVFSEYSKANCVEQFYEMADLLWIKRNRDEDYLTWYKKQTRWND